MTRARQRRRTFNRAIIKRPRPAEAQPERGWYRLENNTADPGSAELYLYDEIGYYGITATDLIAELAALDVRKLDVHISSPGGEIFEGVAIMTALQSHSAYVTVYIDSLAASIASVIAQAGDRRIIAPHAEMMIHNASGVCVGTADDMRELADVLDRQSAKIAAIYAERAGGRRDTWRNRMNAETWFNAEEAVAANLADEISKPTRQTAMPTAHLETSQYRYANRNQAPAPDLTIEGSDDATEDASEAASDETGNGATDNETATVEQDGEAPEATETTADEAEDAPDATVEAEAEHEPAPPDTAPDATADETPADSVTSDRDALVNDVITELANRGLLDLTTNISPTSEDTTPDADPWDTATAHLTDTDAQPDPWSAATAHLTTSPNQDDEFARLTEALQ